MVDSGSSVFLETSSSFPMWWQDFSLYRMYLYSLHMCLCYFQAHLCNIRNVFLRGVCKYECRLLSEVPDRNTWVLLGIRSAAADAVLCSLDPVTLTHLSQLLGQGGCPQALMCQNGMVYLIMTPDSHWSGWEWRYCRGICEDAGASCAGRRMWGAVVPVQWISCSSCLWGHTFPSLLCLPWISSPWGLGRVIWRLQWMSRLASTWCQDVAGGK